MVKRGRSCATGSLSSSLLTGPSCSVSGVLCNRNLQTLILSPAVRNMPRVVQYSGDGVTVGSSYGSARKIHTDLTSSRRMTKPHCNVKEYPRTLPNHFSARLTIPSHQRILVLTEANHCGSPLGRIIHWNRKVRFWRHQWNSSTAMQL